VQLRIALSYGCHRVIGSSLGQTYEDLLLANRAGSDPDSVRASNMRRYILRLNATPPKLIIAYAHWIHKFQIDQHTELSVTYKIVKKQSAPGSRELDEIAAKTKLVLGPDCRVAFEFVYECYPERPENPVTPYPTSMPRFAGHINRPWTPAH
jgi:hypothetical protein